MAGRAEPDDPISKPERPGDRLPEQAGGFSRERFLLRLVALILIGEVVLFAMAATHCISRAHSQPLPEKSICHRVDSSLEAAFAVALNTLLALLGGKAFGESTKKPAAAAGQSEPPLDRSAACGITGAGQRGQHLKRAVGWGRAGPRLVLAQLGLLLRRGRGPRDLRQQAMARTQSQADALFQQFLPLADAIARSFFCCGPQ